MNRIYKTVIIKGKIDANTTGNIIVVTYKFKPLLFQEVMFKNYLSFIKDMHLKQKLVISVPFVI